MPSPSHVIEQHDLRDRTGVFRDRRHAGELLAGLLEAFRDKDAVVLGIPAGGIPVAAELARHLKLPLDVAVVSKVTLPWNTEVGIGAVAFDGTVRLNEILVFESRLSDEQVQEGIEATRAKVNRRVEQLRGAAPFPDLKKRTVILVDDGLASGFTMQVAVEAVRKRNAESVVVAVPTGHDSSVRKLAKMADAVYCLNVRGGFHYAVADAYQDWHDLPEKEARKVLEGFSRGRH